MSDTPAAFARAHTRLAAVPYVPEIRLHQAEASTGRWELSDGGYRSDRPPPFWAFAWAGGQGLARYLLDHPDAVAGRRVLDVASGSGLVAIAAARAGAAQVAAMDIDPLAVAAIGLNARANDVVVEGVRGDVVDDAGGVDVVLAGDAFYSKSVAERVLTFLRRAARHGARVVVGDPDRPYLPRKLFRVLATYDVPVPPALEGVAAKRTTIWELPAPAAVR